MGSVVAILVGLAPMSADGPTRHGHRLASESFRLVLDMEVAAPVGKTAHNCRDSRLDSADEPRQPVVGSTPHSRGTAQGGNRGGAIDGGQVSATAPEAAHADLTNIPDQSGGADGLDPTSVPFRPQHSRFYLSSSCCRMLDAARCTSVCEGFMKTLKREES